MQGKISLAKGALWNVSAADFADAACAERMKREGK